MAPDPYGSWLALLTRLARDEGLEWLIDPLSDGHRRAFVEGATPAEELRTLADMAQWRGCGCGGG